MVRTREPRARARQATHPQQPPQQHPQQPPQFQQQQDFSSFYTHFDTSMSQLQRRLDQQHEENRRSFETIQGNRMQGILVTMANLTIHRQREEANKGKGKAREIVPDSKDSEDTFVSSESEEF
ncbi:hypothetical protein PIB30_101914 [Stylosanthes scabra]|uniref:Uncharacterized protein n=1 Tax=Stylosanthes scabra TaxID=79078 RepID=A0ABU6QWZ7_9FABA|nr:hypothetical protein [Stylosanthes scabra]